MESRQFQKESHRDHETGGRVPAKSTLFRTIIGLTLRVKSVTGSMERKNPKEESFLVHRVGANLMNQGRIKRVRRLQTVMILVRLACLQLNRSVQQES